MTQNATDPDPMLEAFDVQARACHRLGSSMYGSILEGFTNDYHSGGITYELLHGSSDTPIHDAVPLRLLGGLHYLVLSQQCPTLVDEYPSMGGTPSTNLVPKVLHAITDHAETLQKRLSLQVQTNEPARALCHLALTHWLPTVEIYDFRLLEVGASAGLTMSFDHYAYVHGSNVYGASESQVQITLDANDVFFPLSDSPAACLTRRGVDIQPIDLDDHESVLRLLSFVWPDQIQRFHRLQHAISVTQQLRHTIDNGSVDTWLPQQLEVDRHMPTVVFHSIVWQYLGHNVQRAMRETLFQYSTDAARQAPLVWARMEPNGPMADLRVTVWNTGSDVPVECVLADVGYHGSPFRWRV